MENKVELLCEQQYIIKFSVWEEKSRNETFDRVCALYGTNVMSHLSTTMTIKFAEFF